VEVRSHSAISRPRFFIFVRARSIGLICNARHHKPLFAVLEESGLFCRTLKNQTRPVFLLFRNPKRLHADGFDCRRKRWLMLPRRAKATLDNAQLSGFHIRTSNRQSSWPTLSMSTRGWGTAMTISSLHGQSKVRKAAHSGFRFMRPEPSVFLKVTGVNTGYPNSAAPL
jgi:hypothetical protein